MSRIRNLKFAVRDRYAGATDLNKKNKYIKSKAANIKGPEDKLEKVQIAVQTEFVLGRNINRAKERAKKLTKAWERDCPEGVSLGKELYKRKVLKDEQRGWKAIAPKGIVGLSCMEAAKFNQPSEMIGSWDYPRRVVVKVEKPANQLTYQYTFIVTNMDMTPE